MPLEWQRKKNHKGDRLKASQKIGYWDEYNLIGRLIYMFFFFIYAPLEVLRVSFYYFKLKPDLFYGINGQGSAIACLLAMFYRKPVIQRWHGCSYAEEDVHKFKTSLLHKLSTLDGTFSYWLPADAVIVTNDGSHGDKIHPLFGVPPEKIHFWMNGMDIDDMSLPPDWDPQKFKTSLGLSQKKIIMMASRLVLWKRVDRGIDCLSRLVNEYGMKDVMLLILGRGQESENLQTLAKELGVQNHVRFLGDVAHFEVAKYYSIADVFLNLYDFSNLGNPILEAMYCGLPIVSIEDGSTAELLQDGSNAFLIPHARLEKDLPLKVNAILKDASLSQRIAHNAQKTFNDKILSWKDRMLLEYELIQKIVTNSKKGQSSSKADSLGPALGCEKDSVKSLA